MQKIFRKIGLLILCVLPFAASAQTPTQELAQVLDNLHTMRAQFAQTVQDGHGRVMQRSGGEMILQRPGKFFWDIKTPSPQLLIADGQKIYFYDQDLQQVTIQNQHGSRASASPAMLLDGSTISLTQDFTVQAVNSNNALETFKLIPRKQDNLFRAVYLSFSQDKLAQMRLLDNLGQETLVDFSAVTLNATVSAKTFRFVTPKGVDVVNE